MARRGRPTAPLVLGGDERETLERWARRPNGAQALALRCRTVLACAVGATNQEVAAALGVHQATVGKWRGRFVARRLDGLHHEPRPGAPRKISDEHVERVIVKTLEETPADATHWSARSMAKASGLNQTAVSRIWRAQTPSGRELRAVARPAVHRQGPRHRRALPEPAGRGGGVVRGREVPDPGAGSHRPRVAAAGRSARATHP
jgi:transposase